MAGTRIRLAPGPSLHPADVWARLVTWFTAAPRVLYGASLLRIFAGAALLVQFVPSFLDRHYLWGVASTWLDPLVNLNGYWAIFDVLFPKGNPTLFDASYVVFLLLIVAFTLGWRTAWVTPVMWFFLTSLQTNATFLTNGGDNLLRIVLPFMFFMRLSAHFSLDALRIRRRGARATRVPDWLSATAHNTGAVICGIQIIAVYVVSGLWKLQGDDWINGSALYYALNLETYRVLPGLSDLAWQVTPFVFAITFLSVWVQVAFPVMLLWRPSRVFALLFLMGMHTGIAILLGLWPFSLVMIGLDMLFVRDATFAWMLRLAGQLRDRQLPDRLRPAARRAVAS